jgi:hypothetical protein
MTTMLTFNRFPDDWNGGRAEQVQVDPRLIDSVRAADRWASAGSCPVAVIVLVDGDEYVVHDSHRTVAGEIIVAKLQCAAGTGR